MTPKRTHLFPALFLGSVFALGTPHALAGSEGTALPEIRNNYDNILALDKSQQKELLSLGKLLSKQKSVLRKIEISITNLRSSK